MVLALGGASWPRLGSDGSWVQLSKPRGVTSRAAATGQYGLQGRVVRLLRSRFEGEPLKRIALTFGGGTVRGEAIVTADGLEGGAIYALSAPLRDAIERDGEAILASISGPISASRRSDQAAGDPPKGPIHLDLPAQGRGSVARSDIALLREGDTALPPDPEALARAHQGSAPSADRHEAAGPGDLHGWRRSVRGARRAPDAAPSARACSWRARCWTGRRRPAAISCRRRFATGDGCGRGRSRLPAGCPIPDAALTESGPSATPEP